jgi:hypothetical protein
MKTLIKYLLGILFFSSCTGNKNYWGAQSLNEKISTQALDTLKSKPYPVTSKPEIFETAFFKGTEVRVNDTISLKFYPINIGDINLESGRVIACDPTGMYRQSAFNTRFAIGKFPVQLAIARVENRNVELVGYSRIMFSNEPVVKWEFALKEGQKPMSIFGDSSYFYPVDGGLGQFMDESSFNRFTRLDKNSQFEIVVNSLISELDKNTRSNWQFANTTIKGIDIIAFTSGFGDGRYSTYVGYDKEGKPCRLLTDFELIDWQYK